MNNIEFIKYLEYQERIMRELHGVKVALPFKAALESAKAVIEDKGYTVDCDCNYRATGSTPEAESGRDGWL